MLSLLHRQISAKVLLQLPVDLLERAARLVELSGYKFTISERENGIFGSIQRDFVDATKYYCAIYHNGETYCTCEKSPCRHIAALCLVARDKTSGTP